MKTRNGFVSNSSSSSFVVARHTDVFSCKKSKLCLTAIQTRKLIKHGFRLSLAYYPHQVEVIYEDRTPVKPDEMKFANYTKSVVCNQDDEIHFLLKNRISFVANCHYEHESLIYDGKSDTLLICQNYGKQAEMSGSEKLDFKPWKSQKAVEKTTGKDYLKKHEDS